MSTGVRDEKSSVDLGVLDEIAELEAEEDYQLCVRRGG